MAAERYRCETILGYLVKKGARINIQDNKGVTIFQIDYTTESRLVLLIQSHSQVAVSIHYSIPLFEKIYPALILDSR